MRVGFAHLAPLARFVIFTRFICFQTPPSRMDEMPGFVFAPALAGVLVSARV